MCCVKTRAEPGPARGCELVAHPGNGSASVSAHHNVETELLCRLLLIRGVVPEPRPTNATQSLIADAAAKESISETKR